MKKEQIKFGPAGLGPVKTALAVLEQYHSKGLKACEIAFTYGAYIKSKDYFYNSPEKYCFGPFN